MISLDQLILVFTCCFTGGCCLQVDFNAGVPGLAVGKAPPPKQPTTRSPHPNPLQPLQPTRPRITEQLKKNVKIEQNRDPDPTMLLLSSSNKTADDVCKEKALRYGQNLNCSFYGAYDSGLDDVQDAMNHALPSLANNPRLLRIAQYAFETLLDCTRMELSRSYYVGTRALTYCVCWLHAEAEPQKWPSSLAKLRTWYTLLGSTKPRGPDPSSVEALGIARKLAFKLLVQLKRSKGVCVSKIKPDPIGFWYMGNVDLNLGCDRETDFYICNTSNCNSKLNTSLRCGSTTTTAITTLRLRSTSTSTSTSSPSTTTMTTMTTTLSPDTPPPLFPEERPTVPQHRREEIREFERTRPRPRPTIDPVTSAPWTPKATQHTSRQPEIIPLEIWSTHPTQQPHISVRRPKTTLSMTYKPTKSVWYTQPTTHTTQYRFTEGPTVEGDNGKSKDSFTSTWSWKTSTGISSNSLSLNSNHRVTVPQVGEGLLLNWSTEPYIDSTHVPTKTTSSSTTLRSTSMYWTSSVNTRVESTVESTTTAQSKATKQVEESVTVDKQLEKNEKGKDLRKDSHYTSDNEVDDKSFVKGSAYRWENHNLLLVFHILYLLVTFAPAPTQFLGAAKLLVTSTFWNSPMAWASSVVAVSTGDGFLVSTIFVVLPWVLFALHSRSNNTYVEFEKCYLTLLFFPLALPIERLVTMTGSKGAKITMANMLLWIVLYPAVGHRIEQEELQEFLLACNLDCTEVEVNEITVKLETSRRPHRANQFTYIADRLMAF